MPAPVSENARDAIEVRLIADALQPPAASAPGGGSIEPRSSPRPSAPEQRIKPSAPARPVERAAVRQEQVAAGDHPEETSAPEPFATDMLAGDFADATDEVRPHAARRQVLADKPQIEPQGAPDAAVQAGNRGAFAGTGAGLNGGPGGRGRGSGVVNRQFAFGGPVGAFRADVCFIEPSVRLLTDITDCAPVATFYTSVLDVAPRRFNQGFPGLGQRTEWFAIKYRGKFSVSAEDSYTFRLLSDDGARLEIDGAPVLNNDGQHMPIA
ncbi:MAG TPA: PA14 domain-containing protein, partial [Polyangiaceae bacterium]